MSSGAPNRRVVFSCSVVPCPSTFLPKGFFLKKVEATGIDRYLMNGWFNDAPGNRIAHTPSQKPRADVFRHQNPCTEKGVSRRWFLGRIENHRVDGTGGSGIESAALIVCSNEQNLRINVVGKKSFPKLVR